MGTNYILSDGQTVNASVECQSKTSSTKSAALSVTGNVVPLRKAFIQLNPYEIKNGIPVGKSTASGIYSGASSALIAESKAIKPADPSTVDFGQTLRWALGTSSGTIGYWTGNTRYSGAYSSTGVYNFIIGSVASGLPSLGDRVSVVFGTEGDGEYDVESASGTSFAVSKVGVISLPTAGSAVSFYKKPELIPYPNNQPTSNSFTWASPVEPNGGVALSSYTVLYKKSENFSVLKITTTRQHWFYPGLKIKIASSCWYLNDGSTNYNGFSWLGQDSSDVYEILDVSGPTSFLIVAKPNQSYDGSSVYNFNTSSYAYPDIEPSVNSFSYNDKDNNLFSYNYLKLDNIKHLYARGQRIGSVDEFTLAIVATPPESSSSVFSVLSCVDNTIYDSNNYAFNLGSSSSVPISFIVRSEGLTTVTMTSPGYSFSSGDLITISDVPDTTFNGTFKINSVTSIYSFNFYQDNGFANATSNSGNVKVSASDQESVYEAGSAFIWQDGTSVYFGDSQDSPEVLNVGTQNSYGYPNIYIISAKKDSIDMYVSSQNTIYKKTAARKNQLIRKNLVTNPDFESAATGWNNGSRTTSAAAAYVGSWVYLSGASSQISSTSILTYARDTSGIITLTFSSDPGVTWAVGDPIYWNIGTNGNFASVLPGIFCGVINTKVGSTITFKQSESNVRNDSGIYTAFSGSANVVNYIYKYDNFYSDFISIDPSQTYGLSYNSATNVVESLTGFALVKFYTSADVLIESRFCCSSIPNYYSTSKAKGFFKRSAGFIKNIPSNAAKLRIYIAHSNLVDAVVLEPNPKNFNYFSGDGPKYDLDFAIGRMTGTFAKEKMLNGSLVEVDYWNSALDYGSVEQVVSKMRTIYGG